VAPELQDEIRIVWLCTLLFLVTISKTVM